MRYTRFLLSMCAPNKIIKNIDVPSCKNCIYYEPYNGDFSSSISGCKKFGEKNIITDEIKYEYADLCRKNDEQCGFKGKYFYQEPNMNIKKIKCAFIRNYSFFVITIPILFIYACALTYAVK